MSIERELPPETACLIDEQVASGRYRDANDAICDGIHQVFATETWDAMDIVVKPRLERVLAGNAETVSLADFQARGQALLKELAPQDV